MDKSACYRYLKALLFALLALGASYFIFLFISKALGLSYDTFAATKENRPSASKDALVAPKDMLTIDWDTLGKLDVKFINKKYKITVPPELQRYDNARVKVVGYIIPLEPRIKNLSEFIISPSALYLAHSIKPGPSMIMHVKMKNPITLDNEFSPIYVVGVIHAKSFNRARLDGAWEMEGEAFIPYDYPEMQEAHEPENLKQSAEAQNSALEKMKNPNDKSSPDIVIPEKMLPKHRQKRK